MSNAIKRLSTVQGNQEVFDRDFESYDRVNLGLPELQPPEDIEAFRKALDESFRWDLP
jgi:hypothetical protein